MVHVALEKGAWLMDENSKMYCYEKNLKNMLVNA